MASEDRDEILMDLPGYIKESDLSRIALRKVRKKTDADGEDSTNKAWKQVATVPVTQLKGIVGSRGCSNYGKQIALDASEFLAKNNIPVISGMAKGIDGYAHTACLKSGGYTIAFLGHGVERYWW